MIDIRLPRRALFVLGAGLLAVGWVLYSLRGHHGSVFSAPWNDGANALADTWLGGSLPSFLHVVAFSLLTASLMGLNKQRWVTLPALWLGINVVFELTQLSNLGVLSHSLGLPRGTFDVNDLMAACAGGIVAMALLRLAAREASPRLWAWRGASARMLRVSLIGVGTLCIIATSPLPTHEPIYMSYDELRDAFAVEPSRDVTVGGKIYLYGDLLLVSDPNLGIHVIDNADPSNPIPLAFLKVPGNVDIAVHEGILYADSYIDLLAIDIRDLAAIALKSRITDVFHYNPYQAVGEEVSFGGIDRERGVVIGARRIED